VLGGRRGTGCSSGISHPPTSNASSDSGPTSGRDGQQRLPSVLDLEMTTVLSLCRPTCTTEAALSTVRRLVGCNRGERCLCVGPSSAASSTNTTGRMEVQVSTGGRVLKSRCPAKSTERPGIQTTTSMVVWAGPLPKPAGRSTSAPDSPVPGTTARGPPSQIFPRTRDAQAHNGHSRPHAPAAGP